MVKRFLFIDGGQYPEEWISLAAEELEQGAVVVHPTETVHGFGCRWDCREATERIVRIKGRGPGKSMLFLVPDLDWVERLTTGLSPESIRLIEIFWPGPLTLVFKASAAARKACSWLGETVALRRSPHAFTSRLVERLNRPMISTSLNLTGQPVPENPVHFLSEVLPLSSIGRDSLSLELAVIDRSERAGQKHLLPSSVVRPVKNGYVMLREGAVKAEEIGRLTGLERMEID